MVEPRFIVWDFDGTLATREGGWTGTVCEAVAAVLPELAVDAEQVRPHMRRGFPWHAPEVVRPPGSADDWWRGIDGTLDTALREGAGVDPAMASEIKPLIRRGYLDVSRWIVFDDARSVLGRLAGEGWTHLVLSNHVPELDDLIDCIGFRPFITRVYNSARLGVEKPNPLAFERVFADFPGARAGWMVGDNWVADIQGAERAGLRSILVRRDHPDARHQCVTLAEVPDVIERAA